MRTGVLRTGDGALRCHLHRCTVRSTRRYPIPGSDRECRGIPQTDRDGAPGRRRGESGVDEVHPCAGGCPGMYGAEQARRDGSEQSSDEGQREVDQVGDTGGTAGGEPVAQCEPEQPVDDRTEQERPENSSHCRRGQRGEVPGDEACRGDGDAEGGGEERARGEDRGDTLPRPSGQSQGVGGPRVVTGRGDAHAELEHHRPEDREGAIPQIDQNGVAGLSKAEEEVEDRREDREGQQEGGQSHQFPDVRTNRGDDDLHGDPSAPRHRGRRRPRPRATRSPLPRWVSG